MKIAFLVLALMSSLNVFASRVEVDVTGMTCGVCVETITKELSGSDKIENISVSLEDKKARFSEVKGKKFTDTEIRNAIKKAGYEPGRIIRK